MQAHGIWRTKLNTDQQLIGKIDRSSYQNYCISSKFNQIQDLVLPFTTGTNFTEAYISHALSSVYKVDFYT